MCTLRPCHPSLISLPDQWITIIRLLEPLGSDDITMSLLPRECVLPYYQLQCACRFEISLPSGKMKNTNLLTEGPHTAFYAPNTRSHMLCSSGSKYVRYPWNCWITAYLYCSFIYARWISLEGVVWRLCSKLCACIRWILYLPFVFILPANILWYPHLHLSFSVAASYEVVIPVLSSATCVLFFPQLVT